MKIVKPPEKFPQVGSTREFYEIKVKLRLGDQRRLEGLWDVAVEVQRALNNSFGDNLIGVELPAPLISSFLSEDEPYRLEPRWKD